MRKYILKWALLLITIAGVVTALWYARDARNRAHCQSAHVTFNVHVSEQFITEKSILNYLKTNGLRYDNTLVSDIDLTRCEEVLMKQPFIRAVDCYVDLKNELVIEIEQREPILRVYPKYGDAYYIDEDGGNFPLSKLFSADVIVASGNITPPMNTKLYKVASTVHQSTFWRAFIEHIFVEDDGDLVFTTQISGHRVVLGDETRLESKLLKLESFYSKALANLGWEQFKEIHLEYRDQVICRK